MGSTKAFLVRDQSQRAKPEAGRLCVNFGKVLPATATGNLFAVTGTIVVNGLVGIVSTAFAITAVKISIGVTGANSAISAVPASGYASTVVGSAIVMPLTLGGALPAAVVANAAITSAQCFMCTAANITITTDATNTGAVTWLLSWESVSPKNQAATVTAV
jgi:hypothetical protein